MDCRREMGLIVGLLYLLVFSSQGIQARRLVSSEEEEETYHLKKQLKMLNKPYVKSIQDNYGNIFDCVDIYKQPAFDHPLLKNHTIQIIFDYLPNVFSFIVLNLVLKLQFLLYPPMPSIPFVENKYSKPLQKEKMISSVFNESCPSGTVLIRRTTMDDLIRETTYAQQFHPEADPVNKVHQAMFAVLDTKTFGARAEMDVFDLPSVSINQASLAQVILTKGERGPKSYMNSVQFGWRVFSQNTGDKLTHFFIYWTSDGYQKTGCFDILCPGFVQLGQHTTPGMILPGKSMIKLNAYMEPNNGNWVLVCEDNGYELIGYWPKEIFNNMGDCSQVQMGGSVYSRLDEPSPPMGNGVLPSLYDTGAQFRHVELISANGQPSDPTSFQFLCDVPSNFYQSGYTGHSSDTGFVFQYGGPGGFKQ